MANVKKLSNWVQKFTSEHAQPLNTVAGDFLSSESVVLVSGPPKLDGDTDTYQALELIPIGLVQNTQVTQAKQIQQLFEIGSRLPFFVPGRTTVQVGMARVLFDGPSLMQALYVWTKDDKLYVPAIGDGTSETSDPGAPFNELGTDPNQVGTIAGFETENNAEFFINLASEFFNKPLGLGCILYDMQQQAYGGFYLEECYIQSHRFSASAQQTVLMEDVSIRCTALKPIKIDQIGGSSGGSIDL
jgi:hypothetical protein